LAPALHPTTGKLARLEVDDLGYYSIMAKFAGREAKQ
jgi:hypothetical protein